MYKRATMYSKKRNYLSRQGCMGNTKGSSPLDALPRMLLERFLLLRCNSASPGAEPHPLLALGSPGGCFTARLRAEQSVTSPHQAVRDIPRKVCLQVSMASLRCP